MRMAGIVASVCALLAAGCGGDPALSSDGGIALDGSSDGSSDGRECSAPPLPLEPRGLRLGLAGAPLATFGDASAPDFEGAFDSLAADGFDLFFPWFGVREVDGVAEVSGHFDYFLPRSFSGAARHCGVRNPYAAAEGRIGILFPAFLFSDAAADAAFDEAEFRRRYALFHDECWGDHERVIRGHESFDEIATQRTVADFLGMPGPLLANAPAAARLLHELSSAPVYLIEGPLPLLIDSEPSLTERQRQQLAESFWMNVGSTVSGVDVYGFDVYPVPSEPMSASGDFVREAVTRAPEASRHIAVLQGFSYDAQSGRTDPRRGPTVEETRFMAYDALVSGASELLWYGASALDVSRPGDAAVWEGVRAVAQELRKLGGALSGTRVVLESTRLDAVGFRSGEQLLVVVVNRGAEPATGTVSLPGFDRLADVDEEGRFASERVVSGGQLPVALGPYEAKVLWAYRCGG